jgi:CheY-like chemotaxis protein/nitrogen-specific signal transduction histidine kinase
MKNKSRYTAIDFGLTLFIICLGIIIAIKWLENSSINTTVNRNAGLLAEMEAQKWLEKLGNDIENTATSIDEQVKSDNSTNEPAIKKQLLAIQSEIDTYKASGNSEDINPGYNELLSLYIAKLDLQREAINAYSGNWQETARIIRSSKNREIDERISSLVASLVTGNKLTSAGIAESIRKDGEAIDERSIAFTLAAIVGCLLLCWYLYMKNRQSRMSENKVKAAASVKENFLANMSHEIRTPLNAILGFTNILQKTNLDPQQRKHIEIIQTSGTNLLSIVNDILDLSKIEAGMMRIEEAPFRPTDVMASVQQMLNPKAEEKNLQLILKVDDETPETLCGDAMRLTQVLVNLISNAIKFTDEGGVYVRVTPFKKIGESVCLEILVRDTGIGIPKDKQKYIFERFEQAEAETTRRFGGTGLGLSIVKHLIDLQKGTITLNSEEGYGTSFLIVLPYRITNEVAPAFNHRNLTQNIPVMQNSFCKILVAEDNAMNQQLIRHLLKNWGIEFDLVFNGAQAIESLKKQKYDLVLMDIQMPEMDGHTATRVIRNELKLDVPVIAMTAHAMAGERDKCVSSGMNDYISKPLNEETLYSLIVKYSDSANKHNNHLNPKAKVINLQYIESFSDGNEELKDQMLREFVKRVPDNIDSMQKAIQEQNYTTIYRIAHDMKTTVHFLGLTALIGHALQKIEELASGKSAISTISQLFGDVKSVCDKAVDEAVYLVA